MLRPKRWLTLATWPGVQTEIDYNPDTGEIIVARCGGCHDAALFVHDEECQIADCEYNQDEEESADEDEE